MRHVPRGGGDADRLGRRVSAGSSSWIGRPRGDVGDGLPRRRRDPRRRAVVLGRARDPGRGARRARRSRRRSSAWAVDPGERPAVPGHHAHRGLPAVPVLGHVLPGRAGCPTGSSRCRVLSPLWHAVELCRGATTGVVADGSGRRWSVTSPCWSCASRAGCVVGHAHVRRGADAMTATDVDAELEARAVARRWTRLVPGGIGRGAWRVVERNASPTGAVVPVPHRARRAAALPAVDRHRRRRRSSARCRARAASRRLQDSSSRRA